MSDRKLHLGAFMRPVTIHTGRGAIRAPGPTPISISRSSAPWRGSWEEGRFDAFFMADHLAVLNMPMEAL